MNSETAGLLLQSLESIGGLSNDDFEAEDVGMLCDEVRREIFEQLRGEAADDSAFRLVIARLGVLCAQVVRPLLRPQDESALSLLDGLCDQVEMGELSGLKSELPRAQDLFAKADRLDGEELKDEAGQEAALAQATIAQAVKLAGGGIEDSKMHDYIRRIAPEEWMPELWAACAVANGLPQFENSRSHKMRHFWTWYLSIGIPLALDSEQSIRSAHFTAPPEVPPDALKRFASPWADRSTGDPRRKRRAFLNGYVEKVVDTKGRTTAMKFMHGGRSSGKFWVDYQGRRGSYSDESYGGINFQSGSVEEVQLSHLASSKENVPIAEWVSDMEAQLLKDVLSIRFLWFFGWASRYWEQPFRPELHQEDLRICMDSIEWTFEASRITLEEARPYHQIMWCFCAFALEEQVDRATVLFDAAWEEDGKLLRNAASVIQGVAARHF